MVYKIMDIISDHGRGCHGYIQRFTDNWGKIELSHNTGIYKLL